MEPLSDGTKGKSRQEGQPFFSQLDAIAPSTQNPRFWVLAVGATIGAFQFGLLFLGIHLGMPAGLSSLVVQSQAVFTMGFAA
ncbi:MAG TPA: hypothetical protein VGD48_29740, partial [Kutzneria sp.]